jgi:transcription initiation factor TFIID TATA-box-binding protein
VFEREKVERTVKVVNVVASATLWQRVDLHAVVEGFPNAEFPSKRFPGLVFRLKKPKTSSLIFRSGKIICTGGRSENEARKAVESVVRELVEVGILIPKRPKVKIDNIVASADLRRTVDFVSVAAWQRTVYEPDQFPALIYRMDDPKVVFLIFSTGRLICVGAKNKEEIHRAIRKLIQRLDVADASKSPSFDRPNTDSQMKHAEDAPDSRFKLTDFTFSDSQGKACIYVDGLWCNNKLCNGPPCKFANLMQRRLNDGFYGCWGFHWQQGWYTTEIKKSQRKFNN